MDSPIPNPPKEMARRLPRHETDNRVVVTLQTQFGQEKVRGRCSNLSEAGFGAVLAGEVQPGTTVLARLTLQGLEEPLEVKAEVRNRHGFGHGFQFVDITADQRRAVMRCIRAAEHEEVISAEAAAAMSTEHAHEPHTEETAEPPVEKESSGDGN
ncbi:MAG TPA: PilZ domain-containing protein [Terriglobales bacterium]|nr:PilZ domain-containing protein [Terriglobales bacterium]